MGFFFFFLLTLSLFFLDKPWSQVSSLLPPGSCLQFFSRIEFSNPTARRFFHRVLLTHDFALSASQFVHKKKYQRVYTSMHSAGLELTKLTHTRLEDNLIRHRGWDGLGRLNIRSHWERRYGRRYESESLLVHLHREEKIAIVWLTLSHSSSL